MSNRRNTAKGPLPKKKPRTHLLALYGTLIVLGITLLVLGQASIGRRNGDDLPASPQAKDARPVDKVPPATTATKRPIANGSGASRDEIELIDDDGKTLWASPTDGPPLDVTDLPPGVTFVVSTRPEPIAAHAAAAEIWESGRPLIERALAGKDGDSESIQGVARDVIGFTVDGGGNWSITQVARISESANETAAEYFTSKFPEAKPRNHNGQQYWFAGNRAYYLPSRDERRLVVTSPEAISEIIDLAGQPPPLRRDVERLLAHTDSDRHITILFAPNSLFREGGSIFDGPMSPLREPLEWFLGDELSAVAVSFHWDENFYFELIATPTLDTSPERASRALAERFRQIPDMLEQFALGLDPHPYGRAVIARFPAMVRAMSTYMRAGFDRDHAVLNGYLPAAAGHNLLLGAELTLAEARGGASTAAETAMPTTAPSSDDASLREKLAQPVSLQFTRDTLEAAIEQLSHDAGVPIVIRGPDLQAEGITKNQSFGIDVENQPAEEVLVEILRLANPDKSAESPSDAKQKLVYVIEPGENGAEQVSVTTRAAAAARGVELPEAFREAEP